MTTNFIQSKKLSNTKYSIAYFDEFEKNRFTEAYNIKIKKIHDNLENLSSDDYNNIYEAIKKNTLPTEKKKTAELVREIQFHEFTEESLDHLLHTMNKYKNTFHTVGGGLYRKKNDVWSVDKRILFA